ncbi:hypothetical protein RIF29_19709 [Crotalaria pallida]|uniref:Glycoside hydrolase family 3 N-terminal domain-containing protein n=1 Tax=Crotalaria pallida TaxID=3830 RepID=A0AAN9F488_CROPI
MLLQCWLSLTEAEYLKYKDPKQPLNARIKDLMKRMTLEEKIGQMVQIDVYNATADVVKKTFLGSILSGGGHVPKPQATAVDWVNMVNDFQKAALSTRLGIPIIYGIDAVHGNNNVYKATIFPHNIGLGATRFCTTDEEWCAAVEVLLLVLVLQWRLVLRWFFCCGGSSATDEEERMKNEE